MHQFKYLAICVILFFCSLNSYASQKSILDFAISSNKQTDWTDIINKAFISTYDTIYFPKGIYNIYDQIETGQNKTIILSKATIRLQKATRGGQMVLIKNSKNIKWVGGTLDGNNIKGQNGFGITEAQNIRIQKVGIYNCIRSERILGGRAITFHPGSKNCIAKNLYIKNCSIGLDVQGYPAKPSINIFYKNCVIEKIKHKAINCYQGFSPPEKSKKVMSANFDNILIINSGEEIGVLVGDRATNITFNNIWIKSKKKHKIENIIRGTFFNTQISNLYIEGQYITQVENQQPVPNGGGVKGDDIKINNLYAHQKIKNVETLFDSYDVNYFKKRLYLFKIKKIIDK